MSERGKRRMYLVECYWPGVSEQKLSLSAERARLAALEVQRQGRQLEFLGSILIPADETVFSFFEGVEEDVRTVSTQAGMLFERVLESVQIGGRPASEEDKQQGGEAVRGRHTTVAARPPTQP